MDAEDAWKRRSGQEFGSLTRRAICLGSGAVLGALSIDSGVAAAGPASGTGSNHPGFDPAVPPAGSATAADYPISHMTTTLCDYIARAGDRALPAEVMERAKWHLLDTIAAIVAGSQLRVGNACRAFAAEIAGRPVATLIGGPVGSDPMTAAMLNGTLGHSHETDDTGGSAGPWHPGVNVVPAALALGERFAIDGTRLLRAIAVGYDIGGRMGSAAGLLRNFKTPTVSTCGYFGATAAAACIAGLNQEQVRWAMSYTAQQTSGIDSFRRDPDHMEKGFLNGGMGARGGVTSVLMVRAGFTGVGDIFTGPANVFALFRAAGLQVQPDLLTEGLGSRYDIMAANFKRRPVAGAISAVLDSLEALLARQAVDPRHVRGIVVRYEPNSVTDNGGPLDLSMQHAVAMTLVDRRLTFRSIHDEARFNDPLLVRLRAMIRISPVVIYVQSGKFIDPSAPGVAAKLGSKVPVVELTMADGTVLAQGDVPARGESDEPYTRQWVVEKALALMTPLLGGRAQQVVDTVLQAENMKDVRVLGGLLKVANEKAALPDWPSEA